MKHGGGGIGCIARPRLVVFGNHIDVEKVGRGHDHALLMGIIKKQMKSKYASICFYPIAKLIILQP